MARLVQQSGRTGWYYRVLTPGSVSSDCQLELVARPHPDWTLRRIHRVLYEDCLNRKELQAMTELDELSSNWKRLASQRLERHSVEPWEKRLG
jgi:MOSC domain-containing protein YiiM